jgi:hypothetical protein
MVYCYTIAVSVVTFPSTCISLALSCLELLLAAIFQVCSALLSLYRQVLQRDSSGRFRALVGEYGGWSSTCIWFWPKVSLPNCCQTLHYCDTKRNSVIFCICILMSCCSIPELCSWPFWRKKSDENEYKDGFDLWLLWLFSLNADHRLFQWGPWNFVFVLDFRLPPWSRWELHSSGLLRRG